MLLLNYLVSILQEDTLPLVNTATAPPPLVYNDIAFIILYCLLGVCQYAKHLSSASTLV